MAIAQLVMHRNFKAMGYPNYDRDHMMRAPYFSLLLPPPHPHPTLLHLAPQSDSTHAAVMAEYSHGSSGLNDDSGHNDGHCNAAAAISSFDILLLGKTGSGKTTTALKLLEWEKYEGRIISLNPFSGTEKDMGIRASKPESGGGLMHITRDIQAWLNPVTNIRVVDVPGFADTIRHPLLDVWKKNLSIIYQISRLAEKYSFRRILYFLPNRGHLERVDGYLREELQLIYKFFGDQVFKVMVLVCTNDPKPRYQELGFNLEAAKLVLKSAVKDTTARDHHEVEVLYIAYDDESQKIMQNVKDSFGGNMSNKLELDIKACVKCVGNDPNLSEGDGKNKKWWHISWRNSTSDKEKCHPSFRKKISQPAGGQCNDSVAQMSDYDQLVYEFYCKRECTRCHKPPGTKGCTDINSSTQHSPSLHAALGLDHTAML